MFSGRYTSPTRGRCRSSRADRPARPARCRRGCRARRPRSCRPARRSTTRPPGRPGRSSRRRSRRCDRRRRRRTLTTVSIVRPFHSIALVSGSVVISWRSCSSPSWPSWTTWRWRLMGNSGLVTRRVREHRGVEVDPTGCRTRCRRRRCGVHPVEGDGAPVVATAPTSALTATVRRRRRHLCRTGRSGERGAGIGRPFVRDCEMRSAVRRQDPSAH